MIFFIQTTGVDNATGSTNGSVDRQQCLIDKVSEIAITDAGCAHNIGEFIIAIQTSISSTSDSNDYHSSNDNSSYYNSNDYYSSDYYYNYNFDFDIPEDTIDNVCAPNCRNQFDKIYQQCNDDAVSVLTMANCMYILV